MDVMPQLGDPNRACSALIYFEKSLVTNTRVVEAVRRPRRHVPLLM